MLDPPSSSVATTMSSQLVQVGFAPGFRRTIPEGSMRNSLKFKIFVHRSAGMLLLKVLKGIDKLAVEQKIISSTVVAPNN